MRPAEPRRRAGGGLLVLLDAQPAGLLRDRLRGAVIDAILSGRADAGQLLPSTRALAEELGVGRGTVVDVYEQLVAEGYLDTRVGGGTWVAEQVGRPALDPRGPLRRLVDRIGDSEPVDMRPSFGDLGAFPRDAWLSALRTVNRRLPSREFGLPPASGIPELRAELASYLRRTRGAADIEAADIVVVSGVTQGLALLADVLGARGATRFAVETPGHPVRRRQLQRYGFEIVALPVDDDGARVDGLPPTGADAALVTPTNQVPLGVRMGQARRAALLQWAERSDGLVVEDDRGAELVYDGSADPCLLRSGPERVALLGSVSGTLAPGLRLGWLVPPPHLHADVVAAKRDMDAGSPVLSQHALAHLLSGGIYERHLRMLRKRYRMRRDALVEAMRSELPDWPIQHDADGLSMVALLPPGLDEAALVAAAREAGVMLLGLASFSPDAPIHPGVVIDFASQGSRMIVEGVRRLRQVADKAGQP